ncbi:MAG: prepilin-type N-terminal cleavage/methylation domain-containing protein [Planctomycetales bacterium]|nr:prepilin-type N-terminal cleavage/methylation domain-containing protein [Planctomycetales bacterium]
MNSQSGKLKVESRSVGRRCALPPACSAFRFPLSAFASPRRGITLIELLITITIIATLSAVFLGASRSAIEHANAARTKSTIGKIHTLLMEHWASYATRRVDVSSSVLQQINSANANDTQKGQMLADARLLATRELMKMEMPDRWSDVLRNVVPDSNPANMKFNSPLMLEDHPVLAKSYLRRFYQAANLKNDGEVLRRNQGAECLYMIITLATGDGEAVAQFSPQDIGDTDGDGAPEFLDGWGRPIQFVRWPAGFVSDIQPIFDPNDAAKHIIQPVPDPLSLQRYYENDHDPFDHFRRDLPNVTFPPIGLYPGEMKNAIYSMRTRNAMSTPHSAFRLTPLIYSFGPDGLSDILVDTGKVARLDPYDAIYGTNDSELLATARDNDGDGDNWIDNIHNHLQDGR